MKSETVLLLFLAGINLVLAVIASRKPKVSGAMSLILLSLILAFWSSATLILKDFPSALLDRSYTAILFFCATLAASAQLSFAISYTKRQTRLPRMTVLLLGVGPVLTQILFWIDPWHNYFFSGQSTLLSLSYWTSTGLWPRINTFYIYNLIGASVLLLLDIYIRKPRTFLLHYWAILVGALLPFMLQTLNLIGLYPAAVIDPSLIAFSLAAVGFSYGLYRQTWIEITPVTRDLVIDDMSDGWIVLNLENIIVDINPAAEAIIGMSRENVYGQPINSILTDLPNLGNTFSGNQELEMKRSMRSEEGWRYLNIRISTLTDPEDRQFGRLIVWRDITERRLAEDARQRARDEMFVLLNAISSAATNTINLDDFLSESILHIVYPFRSQIVGIFLINERNNQEDDPAVSLASHFGFSADLINGMSYLTTASPLFDWVMKNKQSLLIEDFKNDPRIPVVMQQLAYSSILVIPLITQAGDNSRFVGFICMGRKELPIFGQDEIVRLSMIADQIATLIDSDRRRKLAISLSERQRLVRDLHDSVSQKLYGLVTLTEAAQAALEAGSTVNPSQVLSRIGDNARQAVKEMRLFLYQMQPIDLEKDGLVSVLHHRLAAVEGRADIKARLLADEDISLSKDKEVALYFIAQEALNNVLRHAHAKTVSVAIKQGSRNVILEIVDDGRGFDPKEVDRAGLGLRNMKERTLQIDGKIKITSKPDEGTTIVISVQKDRPTKPIKHKKLA